MGGYHTTRRQLDRTDLCLPSYLTDAEWSVVEPLLPPRSVRGRTAHWNYRDILVAFFYLLRGGLPWRMLPPDNFPPMTAVQHYFRTWRDSGLWIAIHHKLLMIVHKTNHRGESSSADVIDSQSVKTTESGRIKGLDAGKKINGRKRHILPDPQGLLDDAVIHAADIQDCDGAVSVLANFRYRCPW